MQFDFTVIPVPETDMSEDLAEALFEAGCDDCTPIVSNGMPLICFPSRSHKHPRGDPFCTWRTFRPQDAKCREY